MCIEYIQKSQGMTPDRFTTQGSQRFRRARLRTCPSADPLCDAELGVQA